MELRIRETGQIMFESEFRSHLQATGGPSYETLTAEIAELLGVDILLEGPTPTVGRYEFAYRDGAEKIGDKWFTKYSVGQLDDESKAVKDAETANSIRIERNSKLAECDWTQLADAPIDDLEWAKYRQALRDIPSQAGFPYEVEWPKKP